MILPPPELLTPDEMAHADAAAIAGGVAGIVLMENAGRAVARAVQRLCPPCRTLVLCGPGNNGGDGYVAARLLDQAGWPVGLAALAPPREGSDAAEVARRWRGVVAPFTPAAAVRADLVIDAVFGAGLARDVDGLVAETLAAAHHVLAVDVPSGLDGQTGAVRGFAPRAACTVTFFRRKPGHLLLPGRDLCGALVLADIGLPDSVLETVCPSLFANGPALWRLPGLRAEAHKYTRGHLTILAGHQMSGAARLAAAGARHGGAGLVTLAAAGAGDLYRAAAEPGLIVSDETLPALLADERRQTWVCGPGLGLEAARAALPALLAARRTVVADADALTACEGAPERLRGAAVLTPHAGEFARVFGPLGADRVAAVRAAARRTGAVVVLKGADTLIADPDGRVAINDNAPPDLATAGSGDVLAGLVAGLLAQGMAPWPAAAAAVWLHGEAGRIAGPGLLAEDLPPAITRAIAQIHAVLPPPRRRHFPAASRHHITEGK
ncbi:MAG TPA: NAD(P)H-hydrate dehydratase [Acetobacteraceae bacterium]|nr:NAD(P)H-hydrate dehydratase [Acetobacteraceae bacterium]